MRLFILLPQSSFFYYSISYLKTSKSKEFIKTMSNFINDYELLNAYGKVLSQIEYDSVNQQFFYLLTFHNNKHLSEKKLEKDVYPLITRCQYECHLNKNLVNSATKKLNLDDYLNTHLTKQK